jgi:methionine-gamma-lyase
MIGGMSKTSREMKEEDDMDEFDFETLAVHAGEIADPDTGAMRLPLHMATTFKLPKFGGKLFDALMMNSSRPPFAYTRWGNPTLRALEDRLSALEGAEAAVVTASGMAAVSALVFTCRASGSRSAWWTPATWHRSAPRCARIQN